MKSYIWRSDYTDQRTIGILSLNDPYPVGLLNCFTLEDRIRAPGVKVYGATCIPAVTYVLTLRDSPHFGRPMPHVEDVVGFSEIMLHWGVRAAHTLGCILLGDQRNGADEIAQSRDAFDHWFALFDAAIRHGEACTLTIENNVNAPNYAELTAP